MRVRVLHRLGRVRMAGRWYSTYTYPSPYRYQLLTRCYSTTSSHKRYCIGCYSEISQKRTANRTGLVDRGGFGGDGFQDRIASETRPDRPREQRQDEAARRFGALKACAHKFTQIRLQGVIFVSSV